MSSRVEQEPCYVLHRRPYKENSLILDVFAYSFGKVSLISKGSYRGKNNQVAQLQVFQPLLLSWTGRSELKTLTSVEAPSAALVLSGIRLYSAYYLNEILLYLLPKEEAHRDVFKRYTCVLEALQQDDGLEACLRYFELGLLKELGLAPDFAADSAGQAIVPAETYLLDDNGCFARAYPESQRMSGGVALSGKTLMHLGQMLDKGAAFEAVDLVVAKQAKILMRKLLDQALAGRELKSREMMRQLAKVKAIGKD